MLLRIYPKCSASSYLQICAFEWEDRQNVVILSSLSNMNLNNSFPLYKVVTIKLSIVIFYRNSETADFIYSVITQNSQKQAKEPPKLQRRSNQKIKTQTKVKF